MTMTSHPGLRGDRYQLAFKQFEAISVWLDGVDAEIGHSALESGIAERGAEAMRLVYQAFLDTQTEREAAQISAMPKQAGVRSRSRQIESRFGRVVFHRMGHKEEGARVRFPLDRALRLPKELYSHPVQRQIVEEARRGSFEQAIESVGETTAANVPKRQAEEITVNAAADFDAFYAEREMVGNDTLSASALLVLSSDSKGIRMRPESLRDATRKAQKAAKRRCIKGDPMAQKKRRNHDKRMAIVTAVWEQERQKRTAHDIATNLKKGPKSSRPKPPAPALRNKRVWASVEKSQVAGISELFDEADRRDPEKLRTTVVLVDGEEHQMEAIEQQARVRGRTICIVLDLIHALHYLWLAGLAISRKNEGKAEKWVATYLIKLLTRPALDVVAGIRQSATISGLKGKAREPVEKCADYLLKNAKYIRYDTFLANGFPIATGVIEGACRHLIQDRLGITGASWSVAGAEAILRLRSLRSSGDTDAYWDYHLRKETARNYQAAA